MVETAVAVVVLVLTGTAFLSYHHRSWYRETLRSWIPPLVIPALVLFGALQLGMIWSGVRTLGQDAAEWPEGFPGRYNALALVDHFNRLALVLIGGALVVGCLWGLQYLPSKETDDE